jgi:hypothetical protein
VAGFDTVVAGRAGTDVVRQFNHRVVVPASDLGRAVGAAAIDDDGLD